MGVGNNFKLYGTLYTSATSAPPLGESAGRDVDESPVPHWK